MKIHIMGRIVKKQTNFIFSSLATETCQMCFTSTIGYGKKPFLYDAYMRLCNYQFYLLIPPGRLLHSAQSFSFELNKNTIRIFC